MTLEEMLEKRISLVAQEYSKSRTPWVIGFSGGKDSSLVLKILFEALIRIGTSHVPVSIVYCNTGVEIPVVNTFVEHTLRRIEEEAQIYGLPILCHSIAPFLSDTFFVRLIGRGYAPPTNKFRWCTDKLRIRPIQRFIEDSSGNGTTVLLGARYEESEERKRVLSKHTTDIEFYYRQSRGENVKLFLPIVDFNTSSVWDCLFSLKNSSSIDVCGLWRLYTQAAGDPNTNCDSSGNPKKQVRFGCWTCTVVRQDKAVQGLIKHGYSSLKPLIEYRDWLLEIRDNTKYRCTIRRNGNLGLGPFRIEARKELLSRLLAAERQSGLKLIQELEIQKIRSLWSTEFSSTNYIEDPFIQIADSEID